MILPASGGNARRETLVSRGAVTAGPAGVTTRVAESQPNQAAVRASRNVGIAAHPVDYLRHPLHDGFVDEAADHSFHPDVPDPRRERQRLRDPLIFSYE